jgi:hypothetical protein
MADRLDYYFRQKVTEAELDLGFELLEKADHNLAADIGIYGVVGGAIPAQHAPIADLTIDLSAPGRAYDRIGQRVFFGTGQTVNLAALRSSHRRQLAAGSFSARRVVRADRAPGAPGDDRHRTEGPAGRRRAPAL